MICEGTSIVCVTRSRSTVAMKASASNARCTTNVAPHMNAGNIVVIAPLNTSAPECSTTDSGAIRQALAIVVAYIARMKCVCWMPLGSPVVPDVYISVSRSPASTCATGGAALGAGNERAERAIAARLVVGGGAGQHPVRRRLRARHARAPRPASRDYRSPRPPRAAAHRRAARQARSR